MSKSVLLKSSLAKKYWMAFTGLFLCLFLVGHLLGNLQLFMTGEAGRLQFNQYAYFMTTNPAVKILSYVTYISILFHAIDGFLLTYQNRKARPQQYAHTQRNANSKWYSRNMAILGTILLVFIATHMVNFWAKMHFSEMPLHKVKAVINAPEGSGEIPDIFVYPTTSNNSVNVEDVEVKNKTELFFKYTDIKAGTAYKDLHTMVMNFFDSKVNNMALVMVLIYTFAMFAMSFHLMHGFQSAFQSLGANHKSYMPLIKKIGYAFAVVVPAAFASIPIYLFISQS
jgi:succinate dehydrogenase / fumarate reductase, cytochrome b subunit